MNLGIGRVQNINAENLFIKEKSLYEFVHSARNMKYKNMAEYCDGYYGKRNDKKYFGQIVTPINLLGLIQTNKDEELIENKLLDSILEKKESRLVSYYFNYFLSMWQYPVPSTKPASGRNMHTFKPYCILLKMLLELYNINPDEAYLSRYDFSYLFLEPEGEMPCIKEITPIYAQKLIDTRIIRTSKGESQEHGSLGYINNTLCESLLLTKEPNIHQDAQNYYIGFKYSETNVKLAEFTIRTYGEGCFEFDRDQPAGERKVMTEYGKYINDVDKFERWKSGYMSIIRIDEFYEFCAKQGFFYTKNLIRRFVLSLETKPFLLLTGISGSGKTKIAELWIEYLESKNEAEGLQISVGSNWTDNKRILGFNNVLLEENPYQTTKIVEFIKCAHDNKQKEYIVIFDEMNLSRVEMYFADFLSALESRKHQIDLPNGEKIYWGDNLKIIGTVNVDESTYMFSPKVLDRANVIEMNGMSPREYVEAVKDKEEKVYKYIQSCEWFDEYIDTLEKLYVDLNGEFAYRVVDEISKYMDLNTKICGHESDIVIQLLDEQINQKILPKLHGSKAQLKPKLDRLEETFGKDERYVLVNSKIQKMQEDVKKGYASFIGD